MVAKSQVLIMGNIYHLLLDLDINFLTRNTIKRRIEMYRFFVNKRLYFLTNASCMHVKRKYHVGNVEKMGAHFICTLSEEMRPDQTSPKGVDNFDAENEQNIPHPHFISLHNNVEYRNEEANTDPFVR